jgi:hypothetical protein
MFYGICMRGKLVARGDAANNLADIALHHPMTLDTFC